MKKHVSLFIAFTAVSCSSSQMAVSTNPSPIDFNKQINGKQRIVYKSIDVSKKTFDDCNLNEPYGKEILRHLYNSEGIDTTTYTPEKDPDLIFIKQMKACPREEMINSLLKMRNSDKDDFEITAKTSYLLIKLGYNKRENVKTLLETYSTYRKTKLDRYEDPDYQRKMENNEYPEIFRGDQIIYLVTEVFDEDDKDGVILAESFDLVNQVDGGSAVTLFAAFAYLFDHFPARFLKAIKDRPREMKEKVFGIMCYDYPKKSLIKDLSAIPKSSEVYSLSREALEIVKQSEACEDAEKEQTASR